MAKLPPERLAKALKANLKRRKSLSRGRAPAGSAKDPEKLGENPSEGIPPRLKKAPPG